MNKVPFSHLILDQGKALVEQGAIGEMIFSEGTYQVEVKDKETFWPFLQLDQSGKVKDSFCTCHSLEGSGSCPHLAAAYLEIYKQNTKPLHERYRTSLWNILMDLCSKSYGYSSDILEVDKEAFVLLKERSKNFFFIKAQTQPGAKKLDEILFPKQEPTEETSLKFSNLSQDELLDWKKGRPSHHLKYELSFWSDLGKWLMLMQERGDLFHLSFFPQDGALPKLLKIDFKEVSLKLEIELSYWNQILPALEKLGSPIPIYEYQGLVFEKITYNKELKEFTIQSHEKIELTKKIDEAKKSQDFVDLGKWYYHRSIGFYAKDLDPILKQKKIKGDEAKYLLSKYYWLLQRYLTGAQIDPSFITLSYDLFFDPEYRLHIASYLFEKGDLQKPFSHHFDGWVFVDGKGFYQPKNLMFQEYEKIIPKRIVFEFVGNNKLWLNQFEGFQTHLTHIECYLTYVVDKWNRLCFRSSSGSFDESVGVVDFDEWVYIEGRGFYAKSSSKVHQVIQPGVVIPKEDISSFIKSHEEDLETIHQFFSVKQPVEKLGLEVFLSDQMQIVIRPKVSLKKGYRVDQVRFFGDYSFVEKEGFALLPKGGRIPEVYEQERVLDVEEEDDFLIEELPILKPMILHLDPRLRQPKNLHLKLIGLSKKESGKMEFDLAYVSEIGEASLSSVFEAIRKKKRFYKSSAGLLMLQDARFSWLREVLPTHFASDSKLELSSLEWMRLTLFETVEPPSENDPNAQETLKYLHEMKMLESARPFSLNGLKSDLRLYQQTGVRWLWFLYTYGLSGLLCDEMGLGKTHQAMALLAASMNEKSSKKKKFLVVCPTSVIYHWEELLKRFLPKAKVLVFYGISRSLEKFSDDVDILVTSYGTLRSEKEPLSEIGFEIAVFDELHIAKNAHSLTHKALKLMSAKMKLGLTGTPIENRLTELHALFDIILPSYLPQESIYRDYFVYPIEKNHDTDKKKLLSKLIHPFTLRRKKEEVLLELPEKIEEVAYVDLSDEQKALYRQACDRAKKEILKDLSDEGKAVPYLHIFALFNHLKQICNHPALSQKDLQNYQGYKSGKWDLFVELLEEARESGQKVVVFSQYLGMLDIMESYLKTSAIGYAQIRGSTRNRKEQMIRFKEDPHCEVFLGSLQAAGVGIELVSASIVIHYDRWWNPAKENQATDRVHRMGQNRGVQVFKLVCKGTVEEHIHEMIQKKLMLLKEIVAYDDQEQVKQLSKQDLIALIKKIDISF